MRMSQPLLVTAFVIVILGGVQACGSNKDKESVSIASIIIADKPPRVDITIQTSNYVNPDRVGRPSPIVIRLYQLKVDTAFNNANFFALYDSDKDILGDDLVKVEEMEIAPGKTITLPRKKFAMETKMLGVLAAYRNLDNAKWRATVRTPINRKSKITIRLEELTVVVEKN